MFTAEEYRQRRALIKNAMQSDILCLAANGLVQKSADTVFPFRQDSNFFYACGLLIPDAILVLKKDGQEFVVLPKRQKHRDQWEGIIDVKALTAQSGIHEIYTYEDGWPKVVTACVLANSIGSILPKNAYEPHYGMYINPAKLVFARKLQRLAKEKMQDERATFAALRSVKSLQEITAIEKAIEITAKGLNEAKDRLASLKTEKHLQHVLSNSFAEAGADGHAYDPIIACGDHATTIHYEDNNGPLLPDSLVLLDVGAQYNGYAADISRTWAIGTPTLRQQEVYNAVLRVQQAAFTFLKPGIVLRNYEMQVRQLLNDELVQLGLIKSPNDKAAFTYYPHAASHFLGLDVHDAGLYDKPLQEGMVITVEPGIYIAHEAIGVRIEDDVLITKNGIRNLSAAIPSTLL